MDRSINFPTQCPSCGSVLTVDRLRCATCPTVVQGEFPLPLFARLSSEDQLLGIDFIKAGGSLKELARMYGLSYPTVRNRIDALIATIKKLDHADEKKK